MPPVYFITFSTYGTRLHGDERGSVDRCHNVLGTPTLGPKRGLHGACDEALTQPAYLLDAPRRGVVLTAVCQHATFRGWKLLATHIRSNHVHIVVEADRNPERVMNEMKAYASRALTAAGFDAADRLRWARHGSTRWLNRPEEVSGAIHYTVFEQGEIMSLFVAPFVADWEKVVADS